MDRKLGKTWARGIWAAPVVGLLVGLGSSTVASATYLSVDFQGDTAGTDPVDAVAINQSPVNGVDVVIVDSTSTPADPFGGVGNNSLLLEDNADATSGSGGALAAFRGASSGVAAATASMKIMVGGVSGAAPAPYGYVMLGKDQAGGSDVDDIAVWMDISGGAMRIYSNGVTHNLDNVNTLDVVHDLVFNFDTTAGTFTGTYDGVALTAGGGATTVFTFLEATASVDTVRFVAGTNPKTNNRLYVDDVVITPEPGSAALFATAASVLLFRRRSRKV